MIIVHDLLRPEWEALADSAHQALFQEERPLAEEYIDFALLCVESETDDVLAYVTCKAFSPKALYWSYGGAFPPSSGSVLAWRCYQAMTQASFKLGYSSIFTVINNQNGPMLKLAAKMGYKIIGVRQHQGHTLLEHALEKAHAAASV